MEQEKGTHILNTILIFCTFIICIKNSRYIPAYYVLYGQYVHIAFVMCYI